MRQRRIRGGKDPDGHLSEWQISLDEKHSSHVNPDLVATLRMLDVGCGGGQTLGALSGTVPRVGLDVDLAALRLGPRVAPGCSFVCGRAEELPFPSGSFDVVVSRVGLPYTHLSRSLAEVRRVLTPGGQLWAVFHPFRIPWAEARRGNWKSYIYFVYVVLSGLLLHVTSVQLPLPGGGYESFQTEAGIRRLLRKAGFGRVSVKQEKHFVVMAQAN